MDDVIQTAMANGQEGLFAQAVAYCRDLEDKEPMTIRKRLKKFRKKARLFFYYHQSTAWYSGFLVSLVALGTFETIANIRTPTVIEQIYLTFLRISVSWLLASWFRTEMHKVE